MAKKDTTKHRLWHPHGFRITVVGDKRAEVLKERRGLSEDKPDGSARPVNVHAHRHGGSDSDEVAKLKEQLEQVKAKAKEEIAKAKKASGSDDK